MKALLAKVSGKSLVKLAECTASTCTPEALASPRRGEGEAQKQEQPYDWL